MADDRTQRGARDRDRINVNQDHELRHWSQALGVPPQRVKEAVEAVGDRADKVRQYLGKPDAGTKAGTSDRFTETKGGSGRGSERSS